MSETRSRPDRTEGLRTRFQGWRRDRPFAGGVLLLFAGVVIAYVPLQFAFELALVGGGYTFVGLLWAVGVSLTGAFVLYRPDLSTELGVVGVALSILSLLGALGGFLLGMLLGIVGGNLCVAWRPDERDSAPGGDGSGGGSGDGRGGGVTPEDGAAAGRSSEDGDAAGRPIGDEWSGSGAPGRSRTAGGAPVMDAVVAAVARLRVVIAVQLARHRLARRAPFARRCSTGADTPSPRPAAMGAMTDAGTRARPTNRLLVAVGLVLAASVATSLLATMPVAGILGGGDRSTDTLDVGEIRLGDEGRICATAVDSDTYRVTISDARLHDVAVYQRRGGDVVRAELPTVEVGETFVLHTGGENDGIRRLAATAGCTDDDQATRSVFRSHRQSGTTLRASEGVTMVNLQAVDGEVPAPGGFRFVAPADDGGEDGAEAPGPGDPTGAAEDRVEDLDPGGLDGDGLDNVTGDASDVVRSVPDEVDGTNATDGVAGVENATGGPRPDDSVDTNATGTVDAGSDAAANATEDGAPGSDGTDETYPRAGPTEIPGTDDTDTETTSASGAIDTTDADATYALDALDRSGPAVAG